MTSLLVEVENQVFDVTCVLSLTSFLPDDREKLPVSVDGDATTLTTWQQS